MARLRSTAAVAIATSVLVTASAVAARSPAPTKGQCAGAWNRGAPAALLALARSGYVWQATVQEATTARYRTTWRKGGASTTTRLPDAPSCVVDLVLPRGGGLHVAGLWANGTVRWGRPVRFTTPSGASGNACVAADGTIHRVGRFTARTRCPARP